MNTTNLVQLRAPGAYTPAQLDLIKRTVAKDCDQNEFDLFCTVVRNTGLDPFRKQIYALVYNKDDPTQRRLTIVTGIDGMRAIAARSLRYRPDEEEPRYEYDETLKGPDNPLGLVKASVRIWIKDAERPGQISRPDWHPVSGVAYWDEFAPIVEECSEGFRWVETGEFWEDSGKPKRRKVPNEGGELIRNVNPKTQWPKMGRVMTAKCAEAGALRRAFPEDLSAIYEHSEMDQALGRDDWSPTQLVEQAREVSRLERIGGSGAVLFQLQPNAPLQHIRVGEIADRVIEATREYATVDQLDWFESVNRQALNDWWAREPGECLEVKKRLEIQRATLAAQDVA